MFGIIDENKKFILVDIDREKVRATALMLAKETTAVVQDFDEDGNPTGGHTETKYVPMFDEDTVDEAIKEYANEDIETAYTGDKYLKGVAPKPSNEYQSKQREQAYIAEVDPITAHISRLKDETQTPDVVAEIEKLKIERDAKRAEIKERFPYAENTVL